MGGGLLSDTRDWVELLPSISQANTLNRPHLLVQTGSDTLPMAFN